MRYRSLPTPICRPNQPRGETLERIGGSDDGCCRRRLKTRAARPSRVAAWATSPPVPASSPTVTLAPARAATFLPRCRRRLPWPRRPRPLPDLGNFFPVSGVPSKLLFSGLRDFFLGVVAFFPTTRRARPRPGLSLHRLTRRRGFYICHGACGDVWAAVQRQVSGCSLPHVRSPLLHR